MNGPRNIGERVRCLVVQYFQDCRGGVLTTVWDCIGAQRQLQELRTSSGDNDLISATMSALNMWRATVPIEVKYASTPLTYCVTAIQRDGRLQRDRRVNGGLAVVIVVGHISDSR